MMIKIKQNKLIIYVHNQSILHVTIENLCHIQNKMQAFNKQGKSTKKNKIKKSTSNLIFKHSNT